MTNKFDTIYQNLMVEYGNDVARLKTTKAKLERDEAELAKRDALGKPDPKTTKTVKAAKDEVDIALADEEIEELEAIKKKAEANKKASI